MFTFLDLWSRRHFFLTSDLTTHLSIDWSLPQFEVWGLWGCNDRVRGQRRVGCSIRTRFHRIYRDIHGMFQSKLQTPNLGQKTGHCLWKFATLSMRTKTRKFCSTVYQTITQRVLFCSAKDAARAIKKRLQVVMQAKDFEAVQLVLTVCERRLFVASTQHVWTRPWTLC